MSQAPQLAAAATLVYDWKFPTGAVTDIYYLHLERLAYGLTAERLKAHIEEAWSGNAPLISVFKMDDWAWVQVLGHVDFCIVSARLSENRLALGDEFFKIAATNECEDIVLKIPEDHAPVNHFELYQVADQRIRSKGIPPTLRTAPAAPCEHAPLVFGVGRPSICKKCLEALESLRESYIVEKEWTKKRKTERFRAIVGNQLECVRHRRVSCRLCDPHRAYGRRCVRFNN
ncbi:hypothetical protein OCS_03773 [Ophiocordyceps sinensis CO18]|uniref:Uncharacterized protein n=1 Tax=Ophiocordyceps sinensis (strain Co18 / CGMCC 3.14243) TaxID=911162 RepID=T5ADM5_OPHSC|nr:hypothetical protein OCS_03773 [Ophiocordyceps sinensis CO18]